MASAAQKQAKNQKKGKKSKRSKVHLTAKTADKHALYEKSVQEPEADIRFLTRIFRKEYDRVPMSLREDFCGTAYLCAEWVKSHPERVAVGVDLDEQTLDWGRRRHLEPLGEDAQRVTLLRRNVLEVREPKVDLAVAFNFSYCTLLERSEMVRYIRTVKESLHPEGAFILDMHGGPESFEELEETTEHSGFSYVWDQGPIDALTQITHRAIHFRFPDGSKIKNAFRYHWRIWNLPEVRDLLADAGFSRTDIYWEGTDEDGEGNGVFRKVQKAENDESWIAYIVAWQ